MILPRSSAARQGAAPILLEEDIPLLYEDEEEEMGEANPHYWANYILFGCLTACLSESRPELQVFGNLNCYYPGRRSRRTRRLPNFASDIMIVQPYHIMPFDSRSYTIGEDGPAPKVVFEVLSQETAEQRDKQEKLVLYRKLGIAEYVLVDLTGSFLPRKLELRRLQANGRWKNVKEADGGVTSDFGFGLIIDETDPVGLFVVDSATGKRLVHPQEAEKQARHEQERVRQLAASNEALRAEIERLRKKDA